MCIIVMGTFLSLSSSQMCSCTVDKGTEKQMSSCQARQLSVKHNPPGQWMHQHCSIIFFFSCNNSRTLHLKLLVIQRLDSLAVSEGNGNKLTSQTLHFTSQSDLLRETEEEGLSFHFCMNSVLYSVTITLCCCMNSFVHSEESLKQILTQILL